MKNVKTILLICVSTLLVNNLAKGQKQSLYVIDSVAYYEETPIFNSNERNEMFLHDDEIANSRIITNQNEIENLGYHVDTVIFIITNELLHRPSEYKKLTNFKHLRFNNTLLFDRKLEKPFTGQFIDYNINGTIKRVGSIKNGIIEGIVKEYDKKGRLCIEIEYKEGIRTNNFTEYWSNGNIRTKVEKNESQVEHWSNYSSEGLMLSEYSYDKDYNLKYSKSQKERLKKFTTLIPENKFKSKSNYQTFLNEFKNIKLLFNPKSYDIYLFLGTSLFYCGELENAIQILDSAIAFEPSDVDSRICRLYCLIFKYEHKNCKTIYKFPKYFDDKNYNSLINIDNDFKNICQDIQELKNQGYSYECEYIYENYNGEGFAFHINLKEAEKEYCKTINAP